MCDEVVKTRDVLTITTVCVKVRTRSEKLQKHQTFTAYLEIFILIFFSDMSSFNVSVNW